MCQEETSPLTAITGNHGVNRKHTTEEEKPLIGLQKPACECVCSIVSCLLHLAWTKCDFRA